jgi:hypothetical protein
MRVLYNNLKVNEMRHNKIKMYVLCLHVSWEWQCKQNNLF